MVFEEKHFGSLEKLIKKGYLCKEMCDIENLEYKGDDELFLELDDSTLKRAFSLLDECYKLHLLPYVELLDDVESFEEFEKYCKKNPTTLYIVPQNESDFFFMFADMLTSYAALNDDLEIDLLKVADNISLWQKEKEGIFSLKNWNPENDIQLQKLNIDEIYRLARNKGCDVIEHARISLEHIIPMLKKIQRIPPADCIDIIDKHFERMSDVKKWTGSGDILIYRQIDTLSLYESFAYETLKYIPEWTKEETVRNDLECKMNYYIQRIYNNTELTPTLGKPVPMQEEKDKSKSKFNFDDNTIDKIYTLFGIISQEKDLCSKNRFVTMFEEADFSSTLKANGEVYGYICFVTYYFQTYICDKNIKKDWFEKVCCSVCKNKASVTSSAYKSKYWKNKVNI